MRIFRCGWLVLVLLSCETRGLEIVEPLQDEVMRQHVEQVARFVRESMAAREKYFDGAENARALKAAHGNTPKPITLRWQGGKPPFCVKVARAGDGKVFLEGTYSNEYAQVDSLEIARVWRWCVTDADGARAESTFRTEDQAPRLIRIEGVPNARDIGGRRGLKGRRIRQGLLFRTSGLNNNAPIVYYSLAEITALNQEGKLAQMGDVGKSHARQLNRGEKLKESDMRLVKKAKFAPGTKRLTEAERLRILKLYGFKTDIDLRGPNEVYGMQESPLGPGVTWQNTQLIGGYGGFATEKYFDCKRKIFETIFNTNAYPIVFHCIGGADRTGTIAFMVEALLGVDENQLVLDYTTTGLSGGVTDPKHKAWLDAMVKAFRDLPGNSPAEKMNGLFLKMGFSQEKIDAFREFMLEKEDAAAALPPDAFCVKARPFHGQYAMCEDAGGLWQLTLENKKVLKAADFPFREEHPKTNVCLRVYHAPEARVAITATTTPRGVTYSGTVTVKGTNAVLNFAMPARFTFATNAIAEVVAPVGASQGFGVRLNAGFFARGLSHRVNYPTAFSDFMHFTFLDGTRVAIYGEQPRQKNAAWKQKRPFSAAAFGCGATQGEGWAEHAFKTYVRLGETWKTPAVTFAVGKTYEEALQDYAKANHITRTLTEKNMSPTLQNKFKTALQFAVRSSEPATNIIAMLDYLPKGTHLRVYGYMRSGFDREYPDYLPPRPVFGTDADLRALIKAVHAKGMTISLYTNPTLLCENPRGPTFAAIGDEGCALKKDGKLYAEMYGTKGGNAACMWHPALRAANNKVRHLFAEEYNLDILFEDQLGARRSIYDFNPISPSPRDYTEGILSSCEDGMQIAPLATENGWDQVLNTMCMLEGISFAMYPSEKPRPYGKLLKTYPNYPPETWCMELLVQRLTHDRLFYKHHDASQFVTNERTLAFSLAFGYSMHAGGISYAELRDMPEKRAWLERLATVQREVCARYALQKLTSFKHDRAPIFRAGNDPLDGKDDGAVEAIYAGNLRLVVNLGPVARTCFGVDLPPYGWKMEEVKSVPKVVAKRSAKEIISDGTLRDDCWMWGHDPGVYDGKNNRNNIPLSEKVSIPNALKYMGIPNVSVIRWRPANPGDDYVKSYAGVKRVSWVICGRLKDYPTLHDQAFRLADAMPNLVGFDLDDYIKSAGKVEVVDTPAGALKVSQSRIGHAALMALRKEVEALPRHIDLRMVIYGDKLHETDAPAIALADVVTYWTWNGSNLPKLRENFAKYRKIAPHKKTLLGIYMWDFGAHAPLAADFMHQQLACALEFYRAGEIDGFVFHCTPLVNKNLEAVEVARQWIQEHGCEKRKL